MTLVTKPKPKPQPHAKKRTAQHHRRSKAYHKAYWPYLPLLLIVGLGLVANSLMPGLGHHKVLGYATDMSIQTLLSDTNSQRDSNGLGNLGLNAQLDQAAQNKANDMATRDYWSHNTPDGLTPWSFITAVGYNYQTAGENLAYGFDTADQTVTAWMNSPEHRANILNTTYQEVGFGIANSANYQNSGPETIIVAMYAEPVGAAVAASAPAFTPAAPAPVTTPSATQATPKATTPVPSPTTQTQSANDTPSAPSPTSVAATPAPASSVQNLRQTTPAPVKQTSEPAPERISRVQALAANNASATGFATTLTLFAGLGFFLMRHGLAWHKVLRRGENFVVKHQLLDVLAILAVVVAVILTRTAGIIR